MFRSSFSNWSTAFRHRNSAHRKLFSVFISTASKAATLHGQQFLPSVCVGDGVGWRDTMYPGWTWVCRQMMQGRMVGDLCRCLRAVEVCRKMDVCRRVVLDDILISAYRACYTSWDYHNYRHDHRMWRKSEWFLVTSNWHYIQVNLTNIVQVKQFGRRSMVMWHHSWQCCCAILYNPSDGTPWGKNAHKYFIQVSYQSQWMQQNGACVIERCIYIYSACICNYRASTLYTAITAIRVMTSFITLQPLYTSIIVVW